MDLCERLGCPVGVGGMEGRETVIGMFSMKEESVFNKEK